MRAEHPNETFNRTTVECKDSFVVHAVIREETFNRTTVECKV